MKISRAVANLDYKVSINQLSLDLRVKNLKTNFILKIAQCLKEFRIDMTIPTYLITKKYYTQISILRNVTKNQVMSQKYLPFYIMLSNRD